MPAEIFGIAGVQGNGQTELVEAVTGLRQPVSGTIHIMGKDVTKATPRKITELGTATSPRIASVMVWCYRSQLKTT